MDYVKANANIKFDNPHSDGILTKLGFGREWKAQPPSLGDNWTADFVEGYGWIYDSSSLRYIEELGCLTYKPNFNGNDISVFDSGYYKSDGFDSLADRRQIKTHLTDKEAADDEYEGWSYSSDLGALFGNLANSFIVDINSGKWAMSPRVRKHRGKRRLMLVGKTVGDTAPYNNFNHIGAFTTRAYYNSLGLDIYAGPIVEGDTVNETSVNPDGGGIFLEFLPTEEDDDYVDFYGPSYTHFALYFPRVENNSLSGNTELFFEDLYDPYNYGESIQTTTLLIKTPQDNRYKIINSFENFDIFGGSTDAINVSIYIEWVDNHLVLSSFDEDGNQQNIAVFAPKDFKFKNTLNHTCEWNTIRQRKVKVSAAGSVFKIGIGGLDYLTSVGVAQIRPTTYTKVPSDIEYTPNYLCRFTKTPSRPLLNPYLGTIDYYKSNLEYDNDGEITGGKTYYNSSRPIVPLSSSTISVSEEYDVKETKAFYGVSEYREPTIAEGISSIIQTQNNENMRLQRVSGTMDDSWQNHHVDFEIKSFEGTLPEINPNLKTTIEISLDNGQTYSTHFTGYLSGDYEKDIETVADGHVVFSLSAKDPINSRLDKKLIYWQCAFDGWEIDKAFKYILNCAGVPDSNIHIDPIIEDYIDENYGNVHQYIIPMNDKRGTRDFLYEPDTKVKTVLDELVASVGKDNPLRWGTEVDGTYKLLLKEEYVHGTSDIKFVVDRDTTDDDDIVFSFTRSRNYEDFANVFIILGGKGWQSDTKLYIDGGSINNAADSEFVGDLFYEFEWTNSEKNIMKTLKEKREETKEDIYRVFLELKNKLFLHPDDYIQIQVEDVDIPINAVYKIINKKWDLDVERGDYTQQLEAVKVWSP